MYRYWVLWPIVDTLPDEIMLRFHLSRLNYFKAIIEKNMLLNGLLLKKILNQ